jgi:hypothetical protein
MERNIQIIELKNAHRDILELVSLKDEIERIEGVQAVSYIPLEGAIFLNDFKEDGQFRFSPLSITFNKPETTYTIPVEFQGLNGRTPEEEKLFNFDRQILQNPLPISRVIRPNTTMKVKYSDNLSLFRFRYNIKLILTYKEK